MSFNIHIYMRTREHRNMEICQKNEHKNKEVHMNKKIDGCIKDYIAIYTYIVVCFLFIILFFKYNQNYIS